MSTQIQSWFESARWGVFAHYLPSAAGQDVARNMTVDNWNRLVDGFDVNGLADQLGDLKAGYYSITIGQRAGYCCAPNATYGEIVGPELNWFSRRDLIADLADALERKGIRLMVYLAALPPRAPAIAEKFQLKKAGKEIEYESFSRLSDEDPDLPITPSQELWEDVIREWSLRWGSNVSGWWIDCAYQKFLEASFGGVPNFSSFARAMKAGNPESLVTFNKGVLHAGQHKLERYSIADDYTAGELTDALPLFWSWDKDPSGYQTREDFDLIPHTLGFLGDFWGAGEQPRLPDELVVGFTQYMNQHSGVCSWDVPPMANGLIPEPFVKQLSRLS